MKTSSKCLIAFVVLYIFTLFYTIPKPIERDEDGVYVHPDVKITEYVDSNGVTHVNGTLILR